MQTYMSDPGLGAGSDLLKVKGEKGTDMPNGKTWKDVAMLAIPNVICNDPCDAMLHHQLRLNSPLTAVAENRCRATIVSSSCHAVWGFRKISQINYLTWSYMLFYDISRTCITAQYDSCMHHAWVCYAGYLGCFKLCALRVCQGRWNHNVTAGLPVSVYGVGDWNP